MTGQSSIKLGKYEVLKLLDRGSMGIVYLARDPDRGREVAVKVALSKILEEKEFGPTYLRMFFNEAETASKLVHPNIVRIYEAGVVGHKCFIAMEYVKGANTLKTFCEAKARLPIGQAAEIIFKCANALHFAHEQGVIHRDVKPPNILLTEDMDVKVADFSIAHVFHTDGSVTQTQPMGCWGTPRYMSPEQVETDFVTKQSDLFALGVVMYELFTGVHPFSAGTLTQLARNIIGKEPPLLRHYQPQASEGLEAIVRRAIEKNPKDRYRTGLELAMDLSREFPSLKCAAEPDSESNPAHLTGTS